MYLCVPRETKTLQKFGLNEDFAFVLNRLRGADKNVLTVLKEFYDLFFEIVLGTKTVEAGLAEILKKFSEISPEMRQKIDDLFKLTSEDVKPHITKNMKLIFKKIV
ncbi:hypothetical protein RB195_003607 [Necator americanus]